MLKSLIRGKFIGSRSVNNPPEHFVNNQVLTVGIGPYADRRFLPLNLAQPMLSGVPSTPVRALPCHPLTGEGKKAPRRKTFGAFFCDWAYKPGSVLTAIYLAPQLLTGSSHLLGTAGQAYCPTHGVAPDRVYIIKPMLPWAGCALTAPFQPYPWASGEAHGRYLSVALVLKSPSAGVTRYPRPMEPGLSSSGTFRYPSAAVRPSR